MDILIWIGAVLAVVGLIGLLLSILTVWRARRRHSDEEELKSSIRRAMTLNAASLATAIIGLMTLILGLSF